MIFAFDHQHKAGDVCSALSCQYARQKPTLCGTEEFEDVPMVIVREATREEYLTQSIPAGWCIPPLDYGCAFIYEVQVD